MLVFAPFVLRTSFTNVVLLLLAFTIVEQVARTQSTARPMTTKELVAAGLPTEPVVQNLETTQPPEGHSSPAASGSRSHEDGESGQMTKTSEMLTLTSKISSKKGRRDLFLCLSSLGNPRLPLI
jgi:hypothetical protein